MRRPAPRTMRIAAWVIGVLLVAGAIAYTRHEAHQRDYRSCLDTNEGRYAIRQLAVKIVDDDGQRTAAEARILHIVNENLAPRDCDALR